LSEKDVLMARFCDEKAAECGELEVEGGNGVGKELADKVATEGAECCVPKKKNPY
jgi:4a-hydroxytetrahydrobiopterin dehydratase